MFISRQAISDVLARIRGRARRGGDDGGDGAPAEEGGSRIQQASEPVTTVSQDDKLPEAEADPAGAAESARAIPGMVGQPLGLGLLERTPKKARVNTNGLGRPEYYLLSDSDAETDEPALRLATTTTSHQQSQRESFGLVGQPGHIVDGSEDLARDGRPVKEEPLKWYKTHRARLLWLGEEDGMIWATSRVEKYEAVLEWSRNSDQVGWFGLARCSGLTELENISFRGVDHSLIQAFLYRWHPETNSFHLPWGEMTITLHDVHMLLGLRIDGDALLTPLGNESRFRFLKSRFGIYVSGNGTSFSQHELDKATSIGSRRSTPTVDHASGYLLTVLGSVLFNDKTTTHIPTWLVDLVHDHNRTGRYAWGVGVLAYLYRQLGEASRAKAETMGGCTALLQYWIFVHFPILAPAMSEDSTRHGDKRWACRWAIRSTPSHTPKRVRDLCEQLDCMRVEDIKFMPYEGRFLDFKGDLRVSRYRGVITVSDIQEPYMPDRVLRQFGYAQCQPLERILPHIEQRPIGDQYYLMFPNKHDRWAERHEPGRLISFDALPRASVPWAVSEDYIGWFMAHGHPYVLPTSIPQPLPPTTPTPIRARASQRLRVLASRIQMMLNRDEPAYAREEIARYLNEATSHVVPVAASK